MNQGLNRVPMLQGARTAIVVIAALVLGGCSGRPSRVGAPEWDPDGSADKAIADLDADGDGSLSMEELDAAPGLKYCAEGLDAEGDGDGKLSREEIYTRIKLYKDLRVGLTAFSFNVTLDGRPLSGAKVRLVPEPFLGEVVEPNESVSEQGGQVKFKSEGINMSLAKIGMYKIEVTSTDVDIPARYNSETTLGVEIPPVTDDYHQGALVFELKSKK